MDIVRQEEDLVRDRYRIVRPLGRGGTGTTYEAEDLQTHRRVAIKVVSLRQVKDWKILELLEREAKVLQNLNNSAIPKYLDYFHTEEENRYFYLVQELVEGDSLADKVAKGWRPREPQVRDIAIKALETLAYLHDLRPPVIHRNIKPENILLQADGKIFLIDFGAVQDVYRNAFTQEGSFMGTLGYMPPEQFCGQSIPATDLYALGGILLFLLSGKSPQEFPYRGLRLDFCDRVKASKEFSECLEILLEPAVEDRFQHPADAIEVLREQQAPLQYLSPKYRPPKNSKIVLKRTENRLAIDIPPRPTNGNSLSRLFVYIVALWIGWGFSFGFLHNLMREFLDENSTSRFESLHDIIVFVLANPLVALFPLAFIGISGSIFVFYLLAIFNIFFQKVCLEFDRDSFYIQWKLLGRSRQVRGKTASINRTNIISSEKFQIVEGIRTHAFGATLNSEEKRWLASEINDFLRKKTSILKESN